MKAKGVGLLLVLAAALTAQTWSVQLIKPPPQNVFFENLWKCRITNNETEVVQVTLTGWVTKDGKEIARGTSNPITIQPGGKMVTSADITGGKWDYDPEYEPIAMRRGTLPAGSYVYCIRVDRAEDGEKLAQECEDFSIGAKVSPPRLVTPRDGAEIMEARPIFVWTPPVPPPEGVIYTLRIAEVGEGMSAEEVLEDPRPLFEEEGIRTTTFTYPYSADSLEQGSEYAWQVTAMVEGKEIGTSQVWTFSVPGTWDIEAEIVSIECVSVGKYGFEAILKNPNDVSAKGDIVEATAPSPNSANIVSTSPPPSLPQTYDPADGVNIALSDQVTINGTIETTNSSGPTKVDEICLVFQLADANNTSNQSTVEVCEKPTPCFCCEEFTIEIEGLEIQDETGFNLSGNLTAGPNKICKIQARIVNFAYSRSSESSEGCPCVWPCLWPSSKFGNFTKPLSLGDLIPDPALTTTTLTNTGASSFHYSREFIWEGSEPIEISQTPFNVSLLLPDASCCTDTIKMCIRFSFTDIACVTCDTVIGFSFTRCPLSEIELMSYHGAIDGEYDLGYGFNARQPNSEKTELKERTDIYSNAMLMRKNKPENVNDWLISDVFLFDNRENNLLNSQTRRR